MHLCAQSCTTALQPTRLLCSRIFWSRLSFPTAGDISHPGMEPVSPRLEGTFFSTVPPGMLLDASLNVCVHACAHVHACVRACVCACVCVCVLSHSVQLSLSVMSNSLQPHGLQPTRLFCPWNFPGKNTGLGCHFLLQGIFPVQGLNPHW